MGVCHHGVGGVGAGLDGLDEGVAVEAVARGDGLAVRVLCPGSVDVAADGNTCAACGGDDVVATGSIGDQASNVGQAEVEALTGGGVGVLEGDQGAGAAVYCGLGGEVGVRGRIGCGGDDEAAAVFQARMSMRRPITIAGMSTRWSSIRWSIGRTRCGRGWSRGTCRAEGCGRARRCRCRVASPSSLEVDVDAEIEVLLRDLATALEHSDPGIGEHPVKTSVSFTDQGSQAVEIGEAGGVGTDREQPGTLVGDLGQLFGRAVETGIVAAGDDNMGAGFQEQTRGGQAHPAGSAGDQDDTVAEAGHITVVVGHDHSLATSFQANQAQINLGLPGPLPQTASTTPPWPSNYVAYTTRPRNQPRPK
jgi:hypothetical protein